MLNFSRVLALVAVMMSFGSVAQAKELQAATAKPQTPTQAVESTDFTLHWYV